MTYLRKPFVLSVDPEQHRPNSVCPLVSHCATSGGKKCGHLVKFPWIMESKPRVKQGGGWVLSGFRRYVIYL